MRATERRTRLWLIVFRRREVTVAELAEELHAKKFFGKKICDIRVGTLKCTIESGRSKRERRKPGMTIDECRFMIIVAYHGRNHMLPS